MKNQAEACKTSFSSNNMNYFYMTFSGSEIIVEKCWPTLHYSFGSLRCVGIHLHTALVPGSGPDLFPSSNTLWPSFTFWPRGLYLAGKHIQNIFLIATVAWGLFQTNHTFFSKYVTKFHIWHASCRMKSLQCSSWLLEFLCSPDLGWNPRNKMVMRLISSTWVTLTLWRASQRGVCQFS